MQPLLANSNLAPTPTDIAFARDTYRELLQIRSESPLLRLQTAVQIQNQLQFHNVGPEQIPGLIVMSIDDVAGDNVDPNTDMMVILFNATPEEISFTETAVAGLPFALHPVLQNSVDDVVKTAVFEETNGTFTVPAWTTAVFVLPQGSIAISELISEEVTPVDLVEEEDEVGETAVVEEVVEHNNESNESHSEETEVVDSPATPWGIWLGALGGGFLLALVTAWFSQRKRVAQEKH